MICHWMISPSKTSPLFFSFPLSFSKARDRPLQVAVLGSNTGFSGDLLSFKYWAEREWHLHKGFSSNLSRQVMNNNINLRSMYLQKPSHFSQNLINNTVVSQIYMHAGNYQRLAFILLFSGTIYIIYNS